RCPVGVLQLLDAIEPPSRLTPRNRLELGLLPGGEEGVDSLHAVAVANLRPTASDAAVTLGIRCLLALGELCRELECSERLGLVGGHQNILRLMTEGNTAGHPRRRASGASTKIKQQQEQRSRTGDVDQAGGQGKPGLDDAGARCDSERGQEEDDDEDEDEVQSAAAFVAAQVVSSGSAFPMRKMLGGEGSSGLGRFPLRYIFVIDHADRLHETRPSGAVGTAEGGDFGASEVGGDGERISVLVRPVKQRQHSQFDVGFVMWPAAIILSRLLCQNPSLVRGRRVLEIGAGLGLAGLVAARIQQAPSSASNASLEGLPCSSGGTVVGSRSDVAATASVTLSDFNPLVLRALEANVALNSPHSGIAADGGVSCGIRRDASNCDEENGGVPAKHDGRGEAKEATVEHGTVHVRHLDWDKLEGVPGVGADSCRSCTVVELGGGRTQAAESQPRDDADSGNFDNSEPSSYAAGSCFPRDGCLHGVSRGGEDGGVKGIEHGERFDVIIASDHICQASDAEGTIRVLRAMLAEAPGPAATPPTASPTTPPPPATGGQAHFVVAHPRTRWGVDAFVPLLREAPGLDFTCEEVTDPNLVGGLEEAAYLAWLHVHVWTVSERAVEPAAAAAAGALLVAG
ncbi:unnamed protein product, partial [Ectocarpus sp. 6 AP-2014]